MTKARLPSFARWMLTVLRGIRHRAAARAANEVSRPDFIARLLDVSPTPIFVKDEKGRFVTVNRAWLDLMGLTLAEVLGRDSTDLFGQDAARHNEHDDRLLRSEDRVSYENELIVGGREARDTVVTKVRFTRADGTAAGIVGSIVDVTEFRDAERSIREARDAARRAHAAKSKFIANISHELRTPLQGILGFAEIGCESSPALSESMDLFSDIHASGRRMLTLVNDLLDVSQMSSDTGSRPQQLVDVAQLVRDAVGQVMARSHIDLQVRLHGLMAPVECHVDDVRFQQAIHHVMANAARYSPAGGLIEVTLSDRGLAGIQLSVRDEGPGIPPEELELIFEAFVQSSRTRDGSGGSGLGLTIARKIMTAHGGTVLAANAEGGGTVVVLSLPAVQVGTNSQADPAWPGDDLSLLAVRGG